MIVLVDNGHGKNTLGKCSPALADGSRYYEWQFSREIAKAIVSRLKAKGVDARLLVPEDSDISLAERARRANAVADPAILVSIHSNAAGCGQWVNARGWSIYTSPGKTKADALATEIFNAAERWLADYRGSFPQGAKQRPMRADYSDGDPDFEANFYILTHTKCPAVLSENLFHDNKEDVAWLMSNAGKTAIVNAHVDGILSYLKKCGESY